MKLFTTGVNPNGLVGSFPADIDRLPLLSSSCVNQNLILYYFLLYCITDIYFNCERTQASTLGRPFSWVVCVTLSLFWWSCDHQGFHPRRCYGGTERINVHIHPLRWQPCDLHTVSTAMRCQGQSVSRPLLRAWRDQVPARGACKRAPWWRTEHVSSLRWKHDISCESYSQSLQNSQHAPSRFSGRNLKDRWPESHRAQRPACLNTAIFSFKEATCLPPAEEREGVPLRPQSATVVLLNINLHPGTRSGRSPLGTLHQEGIWYLCYFAQWMPVRDEHVGLD